MSSTIPLRRLLRRRPPPPAAQPAFEIQTMPLSPPSQIPPEGLLLETTDVRKGKPDRPPPVSSPEPRHSLPFAEPGKGQERSPRSRSSPAQPRGQADAAQSARLAPLSSGGEVGTLCHGEAHRSAAEIGLATRERCGPGAAAWRDGLAGPRSCPLATRASPATHLLAVATQAYPRHPSRPRPPTRGPWGLRLIRLVTGGDG